MKQNNSDEEQIVRTVCNSHCGGICEIKAHIKGGSLVRLESGEGEESYHRACARGRAYRQRVYAADRLLYPLKRKGTRGAGEFTRISWDEALDTIALEMKKARKTYGPSSILHFCSMCDPHTLHHVQAIHRLLCLFGGYTAPWGTISNEGLNFAAGVTYGTAYGVEPTPFDLMKSRLIIMWGWNPAVTAMGTDFPLLLAQTRERGARVVAIDPRFTDSVAVFADQWIPIRPGTDVAVLLAMAYVMIKENLQDQAFLDAWTVGFDKFKDYVLGMEDGLKKSPEWAEAISGTPAGDIVNLAREFADTKPALLMAGFAAGRTAYGEQFHRAVYTLMAMTGNTAVPAPPSRERSKLRALRNSIQLVSPPNRVEMDSPPRWNALPYRGASVNNAARVNVSQFADAILKGKAAGYPADYKVLWLSNTNYLNQLGDVNKTARALQKLDFILVTEQFMTATAKFADIVLPVCTYLERQDIFASGTGDSYGVLNKAIEPLGESKSQLQICEALAPKLGIADYNDKTDAQWAESIAGTLSRAANLPDYETLKKRGICQVKIEKPPEATKEGGPGPLPGRFPTPSGKIEIYSQLVADMGHPFIPPIPKYIETWESPNDPLSRKYPLQLITPHFKWRAHSQFHNLPWLQNLQRQVVSINTLDAGSRGLHHGDMVRVFNDRGEVRVPVHVTERVRPGVAELPQGAWYLPDASGVDYGGCANVLTTNIISPGGAFTSNTALVQIEKIEV